MRSYVEAFSNYVLPHTNVTYLNMTLMQNIRVNLFAGEYILIYHERNVTHA